MRATAVFLVGIASCIGFAEQVQHFLGETKVTTPAGQPLGSMVSLVRRTLSPETNRIIEEIVQMDARKPEVEEHVFLFMIQGSKFVLVDRAGLFEGSGTLVGKPWQWTGWKYEGVIKDIGRIAGQDTLSKTGIRARKTFSTPDGKATAVLSEDFRPISKEMHDILRAKLLRK